MLSAKDSLDQEFANFLNDHPPILYEILDNWEPFVISEIPAMRAARAAASAAKPIELPPGIEMFDRTVPTLSKDPDVLIRIVRPTSEGLLRPCLYWMHGGGMITGDLRQGLEGLLRWAHVHDCVVVSVDYRLAPETKYPGPVEDCYAGLRWISDHAEEIGVDPDRLLVGGVSAGGGLAAALTLIARDRGEVRIGFQLLLSAMLDDRALTPSQQFEQSPVWNRRMNGLVWEAYLGDMALTDQVPIYAAPGRATPHELIGLPRAFIGGGTLDIFRDEMLMYASHLLEAGVDTDLHLFSGAPHGFNDVVPGARKALRMIELVDDALTLAFTSL